MLLFHVVREIFALEDAVSFNFALGAPHVKRRVKSSRPAIAAPTWSQYANDIYFDISLKITKLILQPYLPGVSELINMAAISYFICKLIPIVSSLETDKNTMNHNLQYVRPFNSYTNGSP